MNKKESKQIHAAAFQSFLASGRQCVKELTVIPRCRVCGRIPRNYCRFDDGTIECAADSRINCNEITS